jgi:NAD(P)-dependent dehydrogenase (short-subunit alcohol dehydrogenase family)
MHLDFTGQTALVTGASRGIGRQIALDLAAGGANLIVTSTTAAGASTALEGLGDSARHVVVDFSDPTSCGAFLDFVRGLDALHVCVNNAGTTRHGPSERATEADWTLTNDVNLKAPYFVCQAAAEVMKRTAYGRIVNIASIWGHITMQDRSIYTATKHGLRGLTISYAAELGPFNILVNVVSPGFTLTDMVRKNYTPEHLASLEKRIPMRRLASVEDVSRAVVFLSSSMNSYITGQNIVVDGGYSVL